MLIVIFGIIIVYCLICLIAGIVQYIKNPKPPDKLTLKEYHNYYKFKEWDIEEAEDIEAAEDIQKEERIIILDETIVKYNKLLDTLSEQHKNTWNDSDKSKILAKQIATMERLTRALEKRAKLDQ